MKPLAEPTPSAFRSFDGTKIAYRRWGKPTGATPLVCCSGIACDEMYWTILAPDLGRERLVVTWDYPYHADSGPAEDDREITVASLARHARSLMEETGINKAAFAGHSMGVQVMFEIYRLFPERVVGMISIAGPHQHTVGHLYGTGLGSYLLTVIETFAKLQPEVAQALWRAIWTPALADPIGRLSGLIGPAPAQKMERYFRHLATLDLIPLIEMFKHGQQHSAADLLDRVAVPVLILHGTLDVMTPLHLAQEMARRIPDAELVAVEGGAHTLPIEDPDLIGREVRRFLQLKIDGHESRP